MRHTCTACDRRRICEWVAVCGSFGSWVCKPCRKALDMQDGEPLTAPIQRMTNAYLSSWVLR